MCINARMAFFTYVYATSPGMAVNLDNVGAKYPVTFTDTDGDFLNGSRSYMFMWRKTCPFPFLVGDRVQPDHRLRSRQRPALSVA